MTKKAILFDLDGTLIDTAPDFIRIIKAMCERYNHATPTDTAIRSQVSAGARAMVRLMFGDEVSQTMDDDPRPTSVWIAAYLMGLIPYCLSLNSVA